MPVFGLIFRAIIGPAARMLRAVSSAVAPVMTKAVHTSKASIKATPKFTPSSAARTQALAKNSVSAQTRNRFDKIIEEERKRVAARKSQPVTPAQLSMAKNDLAAFCKFFVRSGRARLPHKSPFTKLTAELNTTTPLIDTGEFIESLEGYIVQGMIGVRFPAKEHSSGLTFRDIYNIHSTGATVPVTTKTKAYFGAKYSLHPAARYYKIPPRPFLRRAVMHWVMRNPRFARYTILPPF